MSNNSSMVWTDVTGLATINLIRSDYSPASIIAALQAISAAALTEYWVGTSVPLTNTPTTGQPYSGADLAILNFYCVDGTLASVRLPAPLPGIFLSSDGRTVDSANADIVNLINACVNNMISVTGSEVQNFQGGYRKSKAP